MSPSFADVVIVNDVAHVNGGSSQVALSSAIALANEGHRVTVFAAASPVMPELLTTPNLRIVLTDQQEIAADPSRLRAATQGIWNVRAAKLFAQTLSSMDPARSIVHAHGWTKALSSSVLRVAIERRFPVVITLHEYFTACPIGSFYNHNRAEICKLAPMGVSCIREDCDPRNYRDKLWRVARQAVQRSVGRVPDDVRHFITISDLSESVLAPQLPAAAHLHRVNNPIDVARKPIAGVARNTAFTYVGRLSPEKGAVVFAKAAQAAGVRAVFVGDGECAEEVRRCNPSAEITGWLPRSSVIERIGQARALVFPSLWYENSPLVVAEAAALGVPAIVADTCAATERVIDGLTGKHVQTGSVDDLASALKLFTNGPLAALFGAEAYRQFWASPPHMTRHLLDLTQVYETMLSDAA